MTNLNKKEMSNAVKILKRRLDMGRRFRNAMVDFKSEEDLEIYLKSSKKKFLSFCQKSNK